jgi:segregation and condensation protein B
MSDERFQQLRLIEAMIFASGEPVPIPVLTARLPEGIDVPALLEELSGLYANRGVNLVQLDGRWAFRTAVDLGPRMQIDAKVNRKLSRAAVETLAVIAYHQPVTRAEIEEVRGVALSKGTLDTLLEIGWVRPKGRRRTPGRPVTWVTSAAFLDHFSLETIDALPGVDELKAAGLLDVRSAIATLGAQALADTALHASQDREDGEDEGDEQEAESAPEDAPEDALDEAALVDGLGELPEED